MKGKDNFDYFCELKIDGLKIVLEYEKGILKTAATRGDGVIGEDVTENAKTIETIPHVLKKPISGIFEGEVFLSKRQFEKLNKEQKKLGLELYANPRNVAAGTMRQLDPSIVAARGLSCFVYDSHLAQKPKTQQAELELLHELGFAVNPENRLCKNLFNIKVLKCGYGKNFCVRHFISPKRNLFFQLLLI